MNAWRGVLVILVGLVAGCGPRQTEVDTSGAGGKAPLCVYAVNYPLSYFATNSRPRRPDDDTGEL